MGQPQAFDESKYPNWKGQWMRGDGGGGRYDPYKPPGRGQQAPMKPEFLAVLDASLADQRAGGPGWRSDLYLPLARHAAHHEQL